MRRPAFGEIFAVLCVAVIGGIVSGLILRTDMRVPYEPWEQEIVDAARAVRLARTRWYDGDEAAYFEFCAAEHHLWRTGQRYRDKIGEE